MLEALLREYGLQAKAVGALIALAILGKAVRSQLRARRRLPLPPGPPGHWLFGNALPRENQSQQFAEWINEYGPIISLRVGPRTMVIIGRYQESVDIMEKEGGLLADRPRAVAAGEILSRGLRMILAPAGEQFRRLRRAAHTHLQAKAAESYGPIQMQAARDVIIDILDNPKNHQAHANRYAASVILRVTYGKSTATETNAPEIVLIHKMLKRFQTLMRPGALLVEKYPILKYVPGYAGYLHEWRREERQLFHDQLNRVAKELKTGNPGPSFAKYLLENQETHKLSDEEMAYLAGSLFGAGSDTTAVAIMVLVMAAARFPEAQDVVQEELDNVVGRDRAPTFDDYNALPQIQAFMLECLRWRPVTTLGFAHRAQTDIVYKDMCIPEGAIVFGNHWAISRDPDVYPNPDKFDPQRWLGSDGRIREDVRFPSFGFGRRICPGQHIANRSIFINASLLLWSFRITQDPNAPINDKGFVDGVIAHPKPFAACFTPRIGDEKHLRKVMEKYAQDL
ncbi:cytochrome P450 [Pisolithus orientalis]|uniref:cytochrome P450 n=1 Tax=Pisolithus orientalis TaxID=936130 RepID=UPI002223F322|nr:cytochrome P450 [Pisolithus orientalis]KAI5994581.1 cytochrome P450 [Pisolithus orientalis]